MRPRHLLWTFLILAIAAALCVALIDGPLAQTMRAWPSMRGAIDPAVTALEFVFAFPVSKFASGLVVVAIGLVLFAVHDRRRAAWMFVFVGVSQVVTRLVAGVVKNVFLRLRPFEAVTDAGWHDRWFVDGGSSFPSGHATHFWGFYFALALLFPRYRVPLLILPVATSIVRVIVNDHYASDVIASAAIAALVTYGFALAFRRVIGNPSADTPQ
jgi:membrane-associated phospholipid phosphatase